MLTQKLPKLFQSDPVIVKLAELIQGKKTLYSSIVYLNQGKKYIIKKHSETPYFEKDWQCYSFLRCYAKTLITTGSILRAEKDLYQSHFACGDKFIDEMYRSFRNDQKQNVYVMSNLMNRKQIEPQFNHNIYNVLTRDFVDHSGTATVGLNQILETMIQRNLDTVLVECGPVVMNSYFEDVKKGTHKNLIDAVYLAFFQGHLQKNCIGNEVLFQEDLFDALWQSEKINIQHKGQFIGTVYFKAYQKKKQF